MKSEIKICMEGIMIPNKNINKLIRVMEAETISKNGNKVLKQERAKIFKMKKYIILVLLFFSTIVQAQTQIESIQFIGTTADSLVFVINSTISGGADDFSVGYVDEKVL